MYKGQIPLYNNTGYVDNFKFKATVEIFDFRRGRSAAHFLIRVINSEDPRIKVGFEYEMFLVYLLKVIQIETITKGIVYGEWTFYKRGSNYSIGLA